MQGYYAYDGLGRRMEAKEGSSVTFYAYSGTETLADEFSTGTANDYIYAGGMRIARAGTFTNTVTYYHCDVLGSTRLMTDTRGGVVFSDGYQPYGQDNGTPTSSETYKFTGKPVSATTGLYYYGARWYDPSIGRFISQDPVAGHLADPQSLNPYAYVENLPTALTDPSGMDDCSLNPLTWLGCASNGWNSLTPEEQEGIMLGVAVAFAIPTGGMDMLLVGGIFAAGSVGLYVDVTYALGETPTLAGVLEAANLGFGFGMGVYSLGTLLRSAMSIESLSPGARLAANRIAGLKYEEQGAEALSLTRNIGEGRTVLQGIETAGRAVPDYIGDTFFGEAKFTQSVIYNTKQIRIEIEGASLAGKDLWIIAPEGTRIADTVINWGLKYGVRIVKVPFL